MKWLGYTMLLISIKPLDFAIAERSALTFSQIETGSEVDVSYALSSSPYPVEPNPKISTALATSAGNDLRKRSVTSAAVCARLSYQARNAETRATIYHIYRWVYAHCSMERPDPFYQSEPDLFYVRCIHEVRNMVTGAIQHYTVRRGSRCRPGKECFKLVNQVNFLGDRVDDIECRPVAHGKPKDPAPRTEKTIPIRPQAAKPTLGCSAPVTLPLSDGASSSKGAGPSTGQRRYSLSQDLKLTNGLALRAKDMYILDVSSPTPWKRSEVKDASTDSIELTIVGNAVRKIKFCAILAAGYGYSALLHYVVQDIMGKAEEDASVNPRIEAMALAEDPW